MYRILIQHPYIRIYASKEVDINNIAFQFGEVNFRVYYSHPEQIKQYIDIDVWSCPVTAYV